jgi:hypothetical protein
LKEFFAFDTLISNNCTVDLKGLRQVEHGSRGGHIGPQQFLQEEICEHVAALIPVVFLETDGN